MRALCGAIIAAGALIGLGISAIGIGTRYGQYQYTNAKGEPEWIRFWQMDTPLISIVMLLIICVLVGLGLAIIGLAYHHERRNREWLHAQRLHEAATGSRVPAASEAVRAP